MKLSKVKFEQAVNSYIDDDPSKILLDVPLESGRQIVCKYTYDWVLDDENDYRVLCNFVHGFTEAAFETLGAQGALAALANVMDENGHLQIYTQSSQGSVLSPATAETEAFRFKAALLGYKPAGQSPYAAQAYEELVLELELNVNSESLRSGVLQRDIADELEEENKPVLTFKPKVIANESQNAVEAEYVEKEKILIEKGIAASRVMVEIKAELAEVKRNREMLFVHKNDSATWQETNNAMRKTDMEAIVTGFDNWLERKAAVSQSEVRELAELELERDLQAQKDRQAGVYSFAEMYSYPELRELARKRAEVREQNETPAQEQEHSTASAPASRLTA